jgi:hypothetical protein
MKKALLASAACAALGASASFGAVVATVTPLGTPADEFGTGPLTGYTAYKVRLTSDSGKITGVDFSAEGETGKSLTSSVHGFHQVWFRNKGKNTASETDANRTAPTSYDSYFLFPGDSAANVAVGSALTEDNDFTTSPLAPLNPTPTGTGDVYGGGNFMRGAWGIVGAAQTAQMDVAYLVISNAAAAAQPRLGTPAIATEGGTFRVPVEIPEPAALGLAAIGLGGLAIRLVARSSR